MTWQAAVRRRAVALQTAAPATTLLAALGLAFLLAFLLAGCSSVDKPDPTPLQPVAAPLAGRAVWSQSPGAVRGLAAVGPRVLVALRGGGVVAIEGATGAVAWRADTGAALATGPGSDGRFVAVVTQANELVVLDAGKPAWRARLPVGSVTPPLVAGERVFVLGADRSVAAFDALDGRPLWTYQRSGDPLALAQPGVLLPMQNTLLVGIGPRLVGLDPANGAVRSDTGIASTRGTNEVERLADLVAPASRVGDSVCTRAFQAGVACVQPLRNASQWSKNAPGRVGLAGDAQIVVGADASSRITAWRRSGGEVAWTSEALRHRELSAPLMAGPLVVFGDLEGQVHFLDRDSGQVRLRLPTDGKPITTTPVLVDTTVVVATSGGALHAFRPE